MDLHKLLSQFTEKRILVVGDVMLDKYIWGSVDRISPEAPVPVVNVERTNYHSGGAANVARNIHGLGGNVILVGLGGNDESGKLLRSILSEDDGIDCSLLTEENRQTTVKTRIMAHGQQVVRLDRENNSKPSPATIESLKKTISENINSVDGIILTDYGKGVLTREIINWIMDQALANSIPVYVDPKKDNFASFSGARLFKPNSFEFSSIIENPKPFIEAAELFRKENRMELLMVTQSEKGMALFSDQTHFQITTQAREVHDVSGAGDTVIATFTLSDICRNNPKDSAWLANMAAGRVCEEVGVVPISSDSLLEIINHHHE